MFGIVRQSIGHKVRSAGDGGRGAPGLREQDQAHPLTQAEIFEQKEERECL